MEPCTFFPKTYSFFPKFQPLFGIFPNNLKNLPVFYSETIQMLLRYLNFPNFYFRKRRSHVTLCARSPSERVRWYVPGKNIKKLISDSLISEISEFSECVNVRNRYFPSFPKLKKGLT